MGKRTFFISERQGMRTGDWKTTPVSLRGPVTSCCSMRIFPAVMGSSPPMAMSSVLFPHPLGPRMETNSPFWTSIETDRMASISSRRV